MDPDLKDAAKSGDVDFLKEAVEKQPPEYFLKQWAKEEDDFIGGNIFHLAAWADQNEFLVEAKNLLPIDTQKKLLFQVEDDKNYTPLHAAAVYGDVSYDNVKVFKQMYDSCAWAKDASLVKPWLALTKEKMTPLHHALKDDTDNQKCALLILSMDTKFESCTLFDNEGKTPLIYALQDGFDQVAEKILKSPLSRSAIFRSTIPGVSVTVDPADTVDTESFDYSPDCSEEIVKLLFKRCGKWMGAIDTDAYDVLCEVLQEWAETGEAEACKLLLEEGDEGFAKTKIFRECIFETEKKVSDTPLHSAARRKNSELGQILVQGYRQQVEASGRESKELAAVITPPWKVANILGNTPLHSALYEKHEKLALEILEVEPTLSHVCNNKGESPFFIAVQSGCSRVVDKLMSIEEPRFDMIHRNDKTTVLHCLSSCSETVGKRLLEKYWWVIDLRDDKGKTALDNARVSDTRWLVDLLTNTSLIKKEEFDWIEACRRKETAAVLAFVNNCKEDLEVVCRIKKDTPLHHIQLPTFKDYVKFLEHPSIAKFKNTPDYEGATPLKRALEREDLFLAKILLYDQEVKQTIANSKDRTVMHSLAKLCRENDDWEKLCCQLQINPYLRGPYVLLGTNLDQTRNTISIVAALLTTVTFALGFTLPGGLDGETGKAKFATKRSFVVFLIANAYAMCSSMLTLFMLTWSMTIPIHDAWFWVQSSLQILLHSLYATMIAFVVGIGLVMPHNSWVSIVIQVMGGGVMVVVTLAYKNILSKLLSMFSDDLTKVEKHQKPKQEEELEITTSKDEEKRIQ